MIHHDPQVISRGEDRPAMHERREAIVRRLHEVKRRCGTPGVHRRIGASAPVKRAVRFRLRATVCHERVVHGGGAEAVACRRVHRVGCRPGIDQQGGSIYRQNERERIGVRVTTIQKSVPPGIHDQVFARSVQHDISRVLESD